MAVTAGVARVKVAGVAVGHLNTLLDLASVLADTAEAAASAARRRYKGQQRVARGTALRPGLQTPLWNQISAAVRRTFRRRGDKVRLARYLGISRQRLHLLLVAETACPDAERALELLVWLQARRQGRRLDR